MMTEPSNKEIQRNRMLTYFIEATQQIIEDEGIENISIRKVARRAGYNSATIYNYFKDIDQLILLASMKYLKNYNVALSQQIKEQDDPYTSFLNVWDFFCDASFAYPRIFYNLFFGKHSEQLDDIVAQYYTIFPTEMGQHTQMIQDMLGAQTLLERNQKILAPVAEAGYLAPKHMELINYCMICCFKDILLSKCEDEQLPSEPLKKKMHDILLFFLPAIRFRRK